MAQQQKALPTPVDWDELYPGRFIKSADLKGKVVTLTIASVKIEELIGDKGPQIKGLIGFDKTEKQFALNKTNGICLKAMFGRLVQEWIGKRVSLHSIIYEGDPAIRVFGSPDIADDIEVPVQLPRKRPFSMTMKRVQLKGAASPPPPPPPPPPPQPRESLSTGIGGIDDDIPF